MSMDTRTSRQKWEDAAKHTAYKRKYPIGVNCPCWDCRLSRAYGRKHGR